MRHTRQKLLEAIANTPHAPAMEIAASLDPDVLRELAAEVIGLIRERQYRREMEVDARQMWLDLDLKEFQHIPAMIKTENGWTPFVDATFQEAGEFAAFLEKRLESYRYPRRNTKKAKLDRRRLAEVRKMIRRASPFVAEAPAISIGQAIGLYAKKLKSRFAARSRHRHQRNQ